MKAAENLCSEMCGYKKNVDTKPMQWGRQNDSLCTAAPSPRKKSGRETFVFYH